MDTYQSPNSIIIPTNTSYIQSQFGNNGLSICQPVRSTSEMSLVFRPTPLSCGYHLPTKYKSLYSHRTDLDQLAVRRQTFVFWPRWAPSTLDLEEMAQMGLYYTGDGDETKCFSCLVSLKNWKEGDDPKLMHQIQSPSCKFLHKSRETGLPVETDNNDSDDEDCVDYCAPLIKTTFNRQVKEVYYYNLPPKDSTSSTSVKNNLTHRDFVDNDSKNHIPTHSGLNEIISDTVNRTDRSSKSEPIECSFRDICSTDRSKDSKSPKPGCLENEFSADIMQNHCENESETRLNSANLKDISSKQMLHDKQNLKKENNRLKKAVTCQSCTQEKCEILFLPCRHLVTCEQCAEKMDDCIFCQKRILGTVRTYMI